MHLSANNCRRGQRGNRRLSLTALSEVALADLVGKEGEIGPTLVLQALFASALPLTSSLDLARGGDTPAFVARKSGEDTVACPEKTIPLCRPRISQSEIAFCTRRCSCLYPCILRKARERGTWTSLSWLNDFQLERLKAHFRALYICRASTLCREQGSRQSRKE